MKVELSQSAKEELTAWTVLATDGLAKEVRDRVKDEVEDHFRDAVANHLADGMTAAGAEAMALIDLGDIRTAARGFRKRYLTLDDELWLRKRSEANRIALSNYYRIVGPMMFIVTALFTCVYLVWDREEGFATAGEPFFIMALWGCAAAHLLIQLRRSWLIRNSPPIRTISRMQLIGELAQPIFLLLWQIAVPAFTVANLRHRPPFLWAFFIGLEMICMVAGIIFSRHFKIWRKLGPDQSLQVTQ